MTDAEILSLLSQAAAGNERAWTSLVDALYGQCVRWAQRCGASLLDDAVDAEDFAVNGLMKFSAMIRRDGITQFPTGAAALGYLRRCIVSSVADHRRYRQHEKRRGGLVLDAAQVAMPSAGIENTVMHRETIRWAVQDMSRRERQVFAGIVVGESATDTATRMRLPVQRVRETRSVMRERLRRRARKEV